MEYQKLIIEKQNRIGVVKINNPEALNALNTAILLELDQAFDELASDVEVDVIVLPVPILQKCVQNKRQRVNLSGVWVLPFSVK